MAPLKTAGSAAERPPPGWYPWLRGRGSIEEPSVMIWDYFEETVYPWLRGHGSIEEQLSHGSR